MIKEIKESHFLIYSFLASISAILFALYYQYFENYPPCEFCNYQRVPYIFLILIIPILGLIKKYKKYTLLIITLLFFISLIISSLHFGIEKGYWTINTSCSNLSGDFNDIDSLRNFLSQVPITKCDEVIWSYFGISMAGYNMLFSLLNFLLSIFFCLRRKI